ncbi:MAG: glucosamine inositolphosphorylceramide transferase family protein [Steroidobacteraceae bacterium]
MRYAILTTGAPLEDWQRAVVANLTATPGAQADGWLLPQQRPAALHERGLDFILSFAPPAAGRALVRAARWGVWQFFFGDWAAYRGESEGFWEIVDDSNVASAILAQLQDDRDAVRILVCGVIRSHAYRPAITLRKLRAFAAHWPRQLCLKLLEGSVECFDSAPVRAVAIARRRKLSARLAFIAHAPVRTLRDQFQQLACHEQWNIGVLDAPIQSLLDPHAPLAPRWLQRPKRHEFFADPIGIVYDGRSIVFCERLDYRGCRGRISAFDANAPEHVETVEIGPPIHLSYPYLIEDGGTLYCIPETCAANEVALYQVERFPGRWRRVATLVSGLPLIDVTPFRYGERWWFAASLPAGAGANCELYLYHAEALTGPWHPHAANPVKVDIRSARPAGTPFWKDGVFYRPAQDCSGTYGQRVVINRVSRLTTRCFEEEPAAVVDPPGSGAYRAGLHTVSALGDKTLIDAKRHIFVPEACWWLLRLTLRKHAGRVHGRLARPSRP